MDLPLQQCMGQLWQYRIHGQPHRFSFGGYWWLWKYQYLPEPQQPSDQHRWAGPGGGQRGRCARHGRRTQQLHPRGSTRAEFQKIESTLKRLDQPPTQVLIDASIIEVTLNDTLQYGLQWAFSGGTSGGNTGGAVIHQRHCQPWQQRQPQRIASAGFTYSLINSASKVRVILNALASQDLLKVLSNPSLMVLDNHTAMMAVGDQVPVLTSSTDYITNSNVTTSTVQYRDTGVNLAVTPRSMRVTW